MGPTRPGLGRPLPQSSGLTLTCQTRAPDSACLTHFLRNHCRAPPRVPASTPPAPASSEAIFLSEPSPDLLVSPRLNSNTTCALRQLPLEGSELDAFRVLLPQGPGPRPRGGTAPATAPQTPPNAQGPNACSEITFIGELGKTVLTSSQTQTLQKYRKACLTHQRSRLRFALPRRPHTTVSGFLIFWTDEGPVWLYRKEKN